MTHELFQVSGKAILFNAAKDKMVLLHNSRGWWTIPGGHIEKDETPEMAARREIKEELGVDYDGALRLAHADKHYPFQGNLGKVNLYFVGELDESMPISIVNNGDGLDSWEWAPVDKILQGEYEDWLVSTLKGVIK